MNAFTDYFRCPEKVASFGARQLGCDTGYFKFRGAICYGRGNGHALTESIDSSTPDVSHEVDVIDGCVQLPFDFAEVVTNLRHERYHQNPRAALNKLTNNGAAHHIYYFFRPFLPVGVRKHLQRVHLKGWDKIPFPRWPVDSTVERLMRTGMELALQSSGEQRIPFIWFWPDNALSAAIVTHDVEGPEGWAFCRKLMDIDDSFRIKAAFQIVPEERYETSTKLINVLRTRGFEVNIHDLNHDGHLFGTREQFLKRAVQINKYAREFGSSGFRSGAMYRDQEWFASLAVSFDMSVPNVAHLEPQRGGCCTVMPYFIGDVLELPLTTVQDYSIFHIIGDYSIELWKRQIDIILAENGLVTILAHPDYLVEKRARIVYRELLAYINRLRAERDVWVALPGDVDKWWRSRHRMRLVQQGDSWRIVGAESHRARIAHAMIEDGRVVYRLA